MRAMRKVQIAFGLVNIPTKLYKAVDSHDLHFNHFHGGDCLGAVGNTRTCKECGEVVAYVDIVKGIREGDQVVTVNDEELLALRDTPNVVLEVVKFVREDEIDPIRWDQAYYLEPDGLINGYALLRGAMSDSGLVALVRFNLSSRTTLGVMRVMGNVITVHTMHWADEIREPSVLKGVDKEVELDPKMVEMARALVLSMVGDFNPTEFTDTYTERLSSLVEAKLNHVEPEDIVQTGVTHDVSDLLLALQKSISERQEATH